MNWKETKYILKIVLAVLFLLGALFAFIVFIDHEETEHPVTNQNGWSINKDKH
jgi:hypothetical protein